MPESRLQNAIDDVLSSPEKQTPEGVSRQEFCQRWPQIKEGLELLAKLYPKAKLVIALLIEIGDRVCRG